MSDAGDKLTDNLPSRGRYQFPLIAILHLTTSVGLLCTCLSPRILQLFREEPQIAIGSVVAAVIFGAVIGLCVGLGAVRRLPACLLGLVVGPLAALLTLGLIVSGKPVQMLAVAAGMLIMPMCVKASSA